MPGIYLMANLLESQIPPFDPQRICGYLYLTPTQLKILQKINK